jgi:hypothetical protein
VKTTDQDALTVPRSDNLIEFSIAGPGEIAGNDNGNPMDMMEKKSYFGLDHHSYLIPNFMRFQNPLLT